MRDDRAVEPDEVSKWVCDFLAEREQTIDPTEMDRDLFASGKLDSLGVVMVIVGLETRFGVRLTEVDFQDPRFSNVHGLASIVVEARQRSSD